VHEGSLETPTEATPQAPAGISGVRSASPRRVQRARALPTWGQAAQLQRAAGNRAVAARLGGADASRRVSRALIQRDAAAQALIVAALNKPTGDAGTKTDAGAPPPATPGGVTAVPGDAGYQEAYRIINGMAMFDMLSTLTALQRSGQFSSLNVNLATAKGVFTDRIRVACDAVVAKGHATTDDFLLGHKDVIALLPVDQRQNIVNYLDPAWFDDLKFGEDYAPALAAVRGTPAYAKLDPDGHKLAEEIIEELKKRTEDEIRFYLDKLRELFETPEEDPNKISGETQAKTGVAVAQEAKRVAAPAAAKQVGLEEKASGSKARHWIAKKGVFGGGTYYIDRGDPASMFVKVNVFLEARGTGTARDVASVKGMEDGIEKAASSSGYIVDLVFVDSASADALGNAPFTVGVDPSKWEVATNWAGGAPQGYAHELHHLMAFPLDRYNYMNHATNEQMVIPTRLYWFKQELSKAAGYNDPTSIMNTGYNHPNDDDICRVAGYTGADLTACVAARQKARAAKAKGKGKGKGKP
jgi:hypothetical protein